MTYIQTRMMNVQNTRMEVKMKKLTANETAGIRIGTKPRASTGLCAFFAIVMILSGNAALMIPGLIFALVVLIVVFGIQDETCARIGAEEIVLLPEKVQAEKVIRFREVAEWNTRDGIRIRTLSGESYFIETRDTMRAHRVLHRRMPELETSAVRQRQLRERKSRMRRRASQ